MNKYEKELFDIYMKLDKEDLVKIILNMYKDGFNGIKQPYLPILPNQPSYPEKFPQRYPWEPYVWYTISNDKYETYSINHLN